MKKVFSAIGRFLWMCLKFIGRLLRRTAKSLLILSPFLVIAVLALWLALPWVANKIILPMELPKYGLLNSTVEVQSIGPTSAGVGPIVIGERRKHPLRIENLHVDYSLWTLAKAWWHGTPYPIEDIRISGINLSAQVDATGNFMLDTTEWDHLLSILNTPADSEIQKTDTAPIPVTIRRLSLVNTQLRLRTPNALYWASASLRVASPDSDILKSQNVGGNILFGDQQIRFRAVPTAPKAWKFTYDLTADLALARDFFPETMSGHIGGDCTMKGEVHFDLADNIFKLQSAKASGEIRNLAFLLREGRNTLVQVRHNKAQNFTFKAERRAGTGITVTTSDLHILAPVAATARLNASILPNDNAEYELKANFDTLVKRVRELPALDLGEGIAVSATAQGTLNATTGGTINTNIDVTPRSNPKYNDIQINFSDSFSTLVDLNLAPEKFTWEIGGKLQNLTITLPEIQTTIESIGFAARNTNGTAVIDITAPKVQMPDNMSATAERVTAVINMDSVMGTITLQNGAFAHPLAKARGVDIKLPLCWPADAETVVDTGTFKISKIVYNDTQVAAISGTLKQQGMSVNAAGDIAILPIKNFTTAFDITMGMFSSLGKPDAFGVRAKIAAKDQVIPPGTTFGHLLPALEGIDLEGTVSFDADIPINIPGLPQKASIALREGTMTAVDMDMHMADAAFDLAIEHTPLGWRTAAGQTLRVGALRMGKFNITNFESGLRLEENGDISIEGISLKFCGGDVRSLAMRFTPGASQYKILLYCDNLLLRELFTQADMENSVAMNGDARISGVLPVEIEGSNIRLGKGHLYTAPGIKGNVKFQTDNEVFGSLPTDHPGFGQIEFSRMALSDFNYDWIRLELGMDTDSATQGELYLLKLSLFGKPAAPLPFTYNSATGSFVKMSTGGSGIMQEMQLDLNLRTDVKMLDIAFGFNRFLEGLKSLGERPKRK